MEKTVKNQSALKPPKESMDELQKELQELKQLDPTALDESQKSRLSELPGLIWEAKETKYQSDLEKKEKDLSTALAQKEHWREKAEKGKSGEPGADPIDLIKLGKKLQDYDDEELDFVTKFAGTKNPEEVLKALENDFVKSAIDSHRKEVEKKRTLKPNGAGSEGDKPKSLKEQLAGMSISEKEELLKKMGGYRDFRPRQDRTK
jgi:hypothetical protein